MHMKKTIPTLFVSLLLASCQQGMPNLPTDLKGAITGGSQKVDTNLNKQYSIFSDQGDHLKELLAANEMEIALELLEKEWEFFEETPAFKSESRLDQYENEIKQISDFVADVKMKQAFGMSSQQLMKADQNALNPLSWGSSRAAIAQAQGLIDEYERYKFAYYPDFYSQSVKAFEGVLKNTKRGLKAKASEALLLQVKAKQTGFFDNYPIDVSSGLLASRIDDLKTIFETFKFSEIKSTLNEFSSGGVSSAHLNMFGSIFIDKYIDENSKNSFELKTLLAGLDEAKKVGLEIESLGDSKVAFVDVTSKTLLSEGQIAFPTSFDMDLPFNAVKADVKDLFKDTSDAQYVIVFDAAVSKVSRRIKERKDVSSKLISGYSERENPEYAVIKSNLAQAQVELIQNNARVCYGQGAWGCELGKGIAAGIIRGRIKEAQNELASTDSVIREPIHKNYKYKSSTINVKRILSANYYVIDKQKGTYFKDAFDGVEEKQFKLSYQVHEQDWDKSSITSKHDTEEAVDDYENSTFTLKVSDLISQYVSNEKKTKPLKSESEFRSMLMYDKNTALTKYKEEKFDARPLNDARFDSVVVVFNPTGSLGTGFYVAPDLVLTNYHVIEGSQFVEMRLYNDQETFGKVVKSDARLDLALIKTQERGKPVDFYTKNTLDLGETVEAIGHPKANFFTITRGVVSALRKRDSIMQSGGDEILFIQTDTPINSGNSGGPLFMGNKVIGVNDFKMAQVGVEGIAFAIHYSEVQKFLKEDF